MPGFRKGVRKAILGFEHWLDRVRVAGKSGHFSNFGEQEIIQKYIEIFGIAGQDQTVVDIGAGNGYRQSNTYHLLQQGWNVLGIEYDGRNAARLANSYKTYPKAFSCRSHVTPFNVVDLLNAYAVKKEFGILSLDIDGYDYWVLDAILSAFRPRLIVSEYNEKIPPPVRFTVNYSDDFSLRHHFFGYSVSQLKDLLAKHDYVLLEIEFNNVFLAPAELAGAKSVTVEQAYREGYLERTDRKVKFKSNENMEILHSLSPKESLEFLNEFYAEYQDEYQIGLE